MDVTARVVDNLHHEVILGMAWLAQVNPIIDWVSYSMELPGSHVPVCCFPTAPVASVAACSLASAEHAIAHGATVWLALLRDVVDMGSSTASSEDLITPDCWGSLYDKYADVFQEPGLPQQR